MGKSFIQVTTVQVPADTPWEPARAVQAMQTLFALPAPVTLLIRAQAGRLLWQIETLSAVSESLRGALYGVYPQAALTSTSKHAADIGFWQEPIMGVTPFFLPLPYADDLKFSDPLAGVLTVMGRLQADEACVYSLVLRPPTQNYARLGERQIKQRARSLWRFAFPRTFMQTLQWQFLLGTPKEAPRYVPDLQRLAEQKVRQAVKEVEFTLKVEAASAARADNIFEQLLPALSVFARAGGNQPATDVERGYPLVLSAPEVAALWHVPSSECRVAAIAWSDQGTVPVPPELAAGTNAMRLGESRYQGTRQAVYLPYADRVTHVNLIGRTRTGKSTLMHHMIQQDIAAGHGVAVIDPHGDLVEEILAGSIPPEREQDVVLFDLDERAQVIGLNLLARTPGVDVDTTAGVALAVLRKFFEGQLDVRRMEDTLYAAVVSLISAGGYVALDIPRLLAPHEEAFRQQILPQVDNAAARDFWFLDYGTASEAQQRTLAQPINHRIRRLYRDRRLCRIIGQSACLDFNAILAEKKIFLANLRATGAVEGDTVGALLLSKFQMAAMGRAHLNPDQRTPFYLYIDEVQNFITTSLATILSEAAKYGLSLVLANQYLGQLEGRMLQATLGNIGTNIVFRCAHDDAQTFGPLLRPQFDPSRLVNLDRFHAVIKAQYDGRTLPAFLLQTDPPPPKDADAAARAARIRRMSRARYGRPVAEIDAELAARYQTPTAATLLDLDLNPDEIDYSG